MSLPRGRLHRAFAHNDYARERPLLEALEHGFAAVEADVFLVEGHLLVGHGERDLRPDRTLASVYLDPLRDLVLTNGEIYHDATLILLIDVKSDPVTTYAALHRALAAHESMFTQHRPEEIRPGPIEVILSGHVDLGALEVEPVRLMSADGRPRHLDEGVSPVCTMISEKWSKLFDWSGEGPMPKVERARLHDLVNRIHDHGLMARFWGTHERLWPELDAAGVDLIIADDLPGMAAYFAATDAPPR